MSKRWSSSGKKGDCLPDVDRSSINDSKGKQNQRGIRMYPFSFCTPPSPLCLQFKSMSALNSPSLDWWWILLFLFFSRVIIEWYPVCESEGENDERWEMKGKETRRRLFPHSCKHCCKHYVNKRRMRRGKKDGVVISNKKEKKESHRQQQNNTTKPHK